MALEIKTEHLLKACPKAKARITDGIVGGQENIFAAGIDTPLRLVHFLAQIAHESAHLTTTREFASGRAYEGRKDLGNTKPGDGERYRGRGLIQTTGRANYREATIDIRKIAPTAPDFEADPTWLETFPWALLSAVSFWTRTDLNPIADADDVKKVTKKINGGYNGLVERERYLDIFKRIYMNHQP